MILTLANRKAPIAPTNVRFGGQSGLQYMIFRAPKSSNKNTRGKAEVGLWGCQGSFLTHLCHSMIKFAMLQSSVLTQRCRNVRLAA